MTNPFRKNSKATTVQDTIQDDSELPIEEKLAKLGISMSPMRAVSSLQLTDDLYELVQESASKGGHMGVQPYLRSLILRDPLFKGLVEEKLAEKGN